MIDKECTHNWKRCGEKSQVFWCTKCNADLHEKYLTNNNLTDNMTNNKIRKYLTSILVLLSLILCLSAISHDNITDMVRFICIMSFLIFVNNAWRD